MGPEKLCGKEVGLEGQQAHQICNVLRKKTGDHIIVLDNLGWEYDIVLNTIGGQNVTGSIQEKRKAANEPTIEITLYQSLLSREKFEWVLQKCTEIGVRRFVPMVTERSIVHKESLKPGKTGRWQRIIQEAAEQSARGRIPELEKAVKFDKAIANLEDFSTAHLPADYKVLTHTKRQGQSLQQYLKSNENKIKSIALFIGPEGGFSENEVQSATNNNVAVISLGKRILRTETAAIVASSLILYELGEMEG